MNKTTKKPGKRLSAENIATGKRLLKYIMDLYKYRFIMVFICILLSAVASISVSLSLKYLLDDYIIPLIGQKSPNYTELYRALTVLGCIFLVGVIATFTYTRMMVYIGQGVLKKVRDDMFEHMQTLPIRYFDQNTNGSIMSLYTNDTDTLRQMISQAIPQALMSFFTIVVTFISMLVLSPLLTVLAVLIIGVLISATKAIGANSGKYFIRQQMALADVTGFIEERMNGQRVIKVFNHEEISEKEFDELNDALFECAANANKYANMMGPVIGNIGNLQFVLTAVLGGLLSVTGVGGITSSLQRALPSHSCRLHSSSIPSSWLLQEQNVSLSSLTKNRNRIPVLSHWSMQKKMRMERLLNAQNVPVCGHGKSLLTKMVL